MGKDTQTWTFVFFGIVEASESAVSASSPFPAFDSSSAEDISPSSARHPLSPAVQVRVVVGVGMEVVVG